MKVDVVKERMEEKKLEEIKEEKNEKEKEMRGQ